MMFNHLRNVSNVTIVRVEVFIALIVEVIMLGEIATAELLMIYSLYHVCTMLKHGS